MSEGNGGLVVSGSASHTALATVSKTFIGSGATVDVPLFRITGTVRVLKLYGVVTTGIGVNHTSPSFRLYDQTAAVALTAAAGAGALSGWEVGSVVAKRDLLTAVLTETRCNAGAVVEPAAAGGLTHSEFVAVKKTGANTDIEYEYTTTDTPTTGAMQYFCEWQPISADGRVTPV